MKLWVDDIRPAPEGYRWYKSVNAVKCAIRNIESCYWHTRNELYRIELIDIDHDAGDYEPLGGDYIKVLDWLEETGKNIPIHIHTMNPVGRQNMKAIIKKNNWTEVHHLWN